MNGALKKAMEEVASLPEADQQEVAEGLMAYVELARRGHTLLTPEQEAGVEQARLEASESKFATDDEMAATWRKFGL
jgi:hypothetical protein